MCIKQSPHKQKSIKALRRQLKEAIKKYGLHSDKVLEIQEKLDKVQWGN